MRCLALLAIALCACDDASLDPNCTLVEEGPGPNSAVLVDVETVVTGLEVPWSIAFLPDGSMLVSERRGRIRAVVGGVVDRTVAEVPIAPGEEGGLLGLALAPDFATSRAFFIYFTAAGDVNRLERWTLSADGQSAAPELTLIDSIPAAQLHDGGRLRIGPDGMLYVGTGDARDPDLAQDSDSLSGKILRLTPTGAVPADNPFPGSPVFILGIRNTQGFDWLDDGSMIVTDHGPSGELGREGHDEVNIATAGANLGWPDIYGCEIDDGMIAPILTWEEAVPPGGAAIYRGDAIPEWRGNLLLGSLGAEHLHRVMLDGHSLAGHEVSFAGQGRLRDVIMGPDGDLYVTTSNCDGRGACPADGDRILRVTRR